jgi:pimeloyl-ACP methyl ester carboxylesterase
MPEWEISIERYGRWVGEFMDVLGIEQADLVGNSMGGFIACEMAIKSPGRVASLCLVSPAILWQEYRRAKPLLALAQASEASTARAIAGAQKTLASRPRLRSIALTLGGIRYPHLLSPEFANELIHTARRTPGFVPGVAALADYPVREELPKIAAPTLLIWGEHDTLVSIKHADQLAELIPASRVEKWERTGHVAMAERPERFNRVYREFLEERSGADRAPGGTAPVRSIA